VIPIQKDCSIALAIYNQMTKDETIKKSKTIKCFLSRTEKRRLWDLAFLHIPENGLAIEVGTWRGGSAFIIGEVCRQRNAKLICIDMYNHDLDGIRKWKGVSVNFMSETMKNLEGLPIHYFSGASQDVVKYLKDGIADFIFIDGDHKLPVVKTDIEGFWSKLKEGGLYCGHDYGRDCDVKSVVDRFLGKVGLKITIWLKIKKTI